MHQLETAAARLGTTSRRKPAARACAALQKQLRAELARGNTELATAAAQRAHWWAVREQLALFPRLSELASLPLPADWDAVSTAVDKRFEDAQRAELHAQTANAKPQPPRR